ncbi:hypothetical protein Tco_1152287 [Tanacetum coccineum]
MFYLVASRSTSGKVRVILNVNVAWCEYRLHVYGLYEVRISGDRNCQVVRVKVVTKEVILQGTIRSILSPSRDWQFSYEAQQLDTGMVRRERMHNNRLLRMPFVAWLVRVLFDYNICDESALCEIYMIIYPCSRVITDKYVACIISRAETLNKDPDNQPTEMANGFLWETDSDEDGKNSSEAAEVRRSSSLAGQHAIQTRFCICLRLA